ncbi:hypothetical protein DHD05_17870 [Arenibacter sp. N53]|nr:hypothetical protein [Arenibacter sp. N53]
MHFNGQNPSFFFQTNVPIIHYNQKEVFSSKRWKKITNGREIQNFTPTKQKNYTFIFNTILIFADNTY